MLKWPVLKDLQLGGVFDLGIFRVTSSLSCKFCHKTWNFNCISNTTNHQEVLFHVISAYLRFHVFLVVSCLSRGLGNVPIKSSSLLETSAASFTARSLIKPSGKRELGTCFQQLPISIIQIYALLVSVSFPVYLYKLLSAVLSVRSIVLT